MKIEKLNPSVKMFTVLAAAILLSFQYMITLNVVVFAACMALLLFFSDAKIKSILGLLAPAVLAALALFIMGLYYARGSSVQVDLSELSNVPYAVRAAMSTNLESALQLSTRLMAFAGLGIAFSLSTDGESFVLSLMHQCHLSPKFAYGTLAAVNLLPGMVREYRNVRTAFEVRGIKVGPISRKVLFAMLVNSLRWSESVAMAMESKGFCGDKPRTYHRMIRIKWYDLLFSAVVLGAILLGMLL